MRKEEKEIRREWREAERQRKTERDIGVLTQTNGKTNCNDDYN